jgi:hypothetical protein
MFKRLVPVDGSETSTKALVAALELARNSDSRVRILHSLDELTCISGIAYGVDLMRIARDQADKVLQDALDVARSAGIPADSRLVEAPGQRLGRSGGRRSPGVGGRPDRRGHPWPARSGPDPAGQRRGAGDPNGPRAGAQHPRQ